LQTYVDAFFGEILTTLEKVNWLVNYGEKYLQPEYRETGSLTMHKSARVEYVPRGVVGAIVSWNYPFHNILGPIVAAIFAGNGIVVKPSEYCAWSTSKYFEKIVDTLLAKHGVNTSLVQFVYGGPEVGQCLIASDIAKITFIGSPQVGAKVMTAASLHIKPVVLELGGKDAAIICEDVDLNQVVPIIMRGVFQNSGQNCVGLERIIVHEKIYEDLIERVVPLVKNLRQGSPLAGQVDVGAMTMVKNAQVLVAFIEHAAAAGARLLVGGKIAKDEHNGQYFEPTVIVDVDPKSYLFRQESFAPIMTICRFRSDQEAVDLVNSTQYGLGGSVFCNNIARAEKIAKNLDVGMVNVNDFGVNYLCQSLPFGGVKKSGFGRFAGVEGLRDECVVRAVTTDKLSWMKTTIPGPLNYPLGKSSKDFCKGLGKFGYGQSISDRVSGIVDLVKASMAPKK
jgi:aldehyde dehydrogenase (NAD+)